MSTEYEQEYFCQDVWGRLQRSGNTVIHKLHGVRQLGREDRRGFLHHPMHAFRQLSFADAYLEAFENAPTAIVLLGKTGLLAVTTHIDTDELHSGSKVEEQIYGQIVSLTPSRSELVATLRVNESLDIGRGWMQMANGVFDPRISYRHASIVLRSAGVEIADLESENGTNVAVAADERGEDEANGTTHEQLWVGPATKLDGPLEPGQA
jgi:hypothetical protein